MKVAGLPALALLVALIAPSAAQGPPTGTVERPAKTWRQKEHGKLYRYKTEKNIPQLAANGTGDVVVGAFLIGEWGYPPGGSANLSAPLFGGCCLLC